MFYGASIVQCTVETDILDVKTGEWQRKIMPFDEYQEYLDSFPKDFCGDRIAPQSFYYHKMCENCGKYVFHTLLVAKMCPVCLTSQNRFAVELSFDYSTSQKMDRVLKWCRQYPGYFEVGNRHTLSVFNFEHYMQHKKILDEILLAVSKWKSFQVCMCGMYCKGSVLQKYLWELDCLRKRGLL